MKVPAFCFIILLSRRIQGLGRGAPGSETKAGVPQIVWCIGHIHKKGKWSFPRDPQLQKLNRMKLMPEVFHRSRKYSSLGVWLFCHRDSLHTPNP